MRNGFTVFLYLLLAGQLACTGKLSVNRTDGTNDGSSGDESEATETSGTGVNDKSAPLAPGVALTLTETDSGVATMTWKGAGSDAESQITKQEVLIYGGDDSSCSGSPHVVKTIAANASSYRWNYGAGDPTYGRIRFRVRATNEAGLSAMSACSGSISLRVGAIKHEGYVDGGEFGFVTIFADLNNDGLEDIVSYNATALHVFVSNSNLWEGSYVSFAADATYTCTSVKVGDVMGDAGKEILCRDAAYDSNRGAVHVLSYQSSWAHGTLGSAIARTYQSDNASDGLALVEVGDIDGDGREDIVVGSSGSDENTFSNSGMIAVILGATTLPASGALSTVGRRYDGDETNARLGQAMMLADLTNDGRDEIITCSSVATTGGNAYGAVYVMPGAASLPATGIWNSVGGLEYAGDASSDELCANIDSVEIINPNGDAYNDLLVLDDSWGTTSAIYILPGAASLPASGDFRTQGRRYYADTAGDEVEIGAYHGVTLEANIEGDSNLELIMGSWGSQSGAGVIYVFPGQSTFPASDSFSTVGVRRYVGSASCQLGYALFVEDLNGDGRDDLFSACASALAFKAWALQGNASLPASNDIDSVGSTYTGAFSWSIADFDGDGTADIISRLLSHGGLTSNGAIAISSPSGGNIPAASAVTSWANIYHGPENNATFGVVRLFADLNGDGIDDLIAGSASAGSYGTYNGAANAGTIGVLAGSSTLPASAAMGTVGSWLGGEASERLKPGENYANLSPSGGELNSVYDFNGDGYSDIVIDCTGCDEIYLVFGNASLTGLSMVKVADTAWGDLRPNINISQSSRTSYLKDLDGDGIKDIIMLNEDHDSTSMTDNGSLMILPGATFR